MIGGPGPGPGLEREAVGCPARRIATDWEPNVRRVQIVLQGLVCLCLGAAAVLLFVDLLQASLAFFAAIACSHLESVLRIDRCLAEMKETLGVLRKLDGRVEEKGRATAYLMEPPAGRPDAHDRG